jgi:hypothetical protein
MLDLTKIKEDMTVYDADGNKMGTVEYVRFSDEDPNKLGPETTTHSEFDATKNSIVSAFALAISADDLPDEVKMHLMRTGFIQLTTSNILKSDRYIPLDQVSDVIGENIHLSATKDEVFTV